MFKNNSRFAWLNKRMRNTFFIKLIMTTALIAIIPNLLSDVVAYYKVSKTFEEETGKTKQQYLNQTRNALEIVLKRIKENSNLLALNQAFVEFEKFPNGSYYEDLQGELGKEDLPTLYGYLAAKTNSISTINTFRISNEFVDSVYYYDSSKNLVITSDNSGSNRQFDLDDFYDRDWYDTLIESKEYYVFMDTRITKAYSSKEKNLLSIIYKTNKDNNAFIINLDASVIYNEIINKLNHQDNIYVVSSAGKILFHSNPASMHQHLSLILPEEKDIVGRSGSFVKQLAGKNKLISHSASPLLGWTFVNISDMEALSKGTASIKQTIVLSALVLVLLTLTLTYLSSRSLYKPISRLKAMIGGESERKTEQTDEIDTIGIFMQSAIHDRDYYKEKLDESLPFQREQFKYSLLRQHSMNLEEIGSKKDYLGVHIDLGDLVVLALSLDDHNISGMERGMITNFTNDLFKLRIMDQIIQSPVIQTPYYLVDAEKDIIAIVMGRGGMDQQQLFLIGQQLLDEMSLKLRSTCTIGIGRVCSSILDLPQAYEDALEALKYRILYGNGYVISIDDIRIDNKTGFHYPKQKEELLLGHLKTARTEEALQAFDEFVSEINMHKNKLHYNQIRPLFMQLLTGIMNAYTQLGADMRAVLGGETDPYRELLDQDSMDKIGKWFHRLIYLTTAYIEREMNAKGNHHITRVIDIIGRNYCQDISLNSVAEELNLNPAYISRLFKQITGQPFVDVLKKVRIERSKELLVQSDLKINEISKQVGYSNSYYFIKVFKDMMGLTPGEYKKMNS
ncbi:helix-turn-helix domain-containing protein [Paenibacillus sp. LMG 31460]|uniref:Helix-turn-helix domain-containing protein n=1 Tax=Paenibacillus germinis TaxID=2654979 RepID=A0ABX1YZC8_9BACL|nr:helix-turn-helix domain-containing protein [Paenibacillus germinis]NOU86307.1 helix-turn-helix domain-containing protein [Paenibacillus germinis]